MSLAQLTIICAIVWSGAFVIAEPETARTVEFAALMLLGIAAFLLIAYAIGQWIAQDEEGNL